MNYNSLTLSMLISLVVLIGVLVDNKHLISKCTNQNQRYSLSYPSCTCIKDWMQCFLATNYNYDFVFTLHLSQIPAM